MVLPTEKAKMPPEVDCHPVSNDDAGCQANLSDTSPDGAFDFSEAPFRSSRKVLSSQTKVVTLCNRAAGLIGPTIHLFGTCAHDSHFELPASQGGRLPTQGLGSLTRRPQNDSGSPT